MRTHLNDPTTSRNASTRYPRRRALAPRDHEIVASLYAELFESFDLAGGGPLDRDYADLADAAVNGRHGEGRR